MNDLYVNTTSLNGTHFLRGVELIVQARDEYKVPSENWPVPSRYKFGSPCERYYSEIWSDGMDWQVSYWVIEEKHLEKPHIYPFLIFYSNEDRELFNDYDLEQLIHACLYYRRDKYWINHNDWGHYTDMVWPYLKLVNEQIEHKTMKKYSFKHASQPRVSFLLNYKFIPEEYR